MKLQQVIMRGPGILVSAMVVVVCGACEHAPDPEYDQGMPEAGGRFVTLRGADDVGVLSVDSPVTLSFDREEKFFHGANDAALLSEGSVAIANQQSGEIFVFDASGRFVRTVGRPGSGPGEFRNLKSVIAIEGDTIVALDGSSRTVSLFASTGEFIDGYKIDAPPEAIQTGSMILEGSVGPRQFLIWTLARPTPETLNQAPNQVVRVPVVAFITDSSGHASRIVGQFPGDDQWFSDVSGMATSYGLAPFGSRTWFGVFNGKTVVLRNTEPGFRVLLSNGEPHAVYQGDLRARKVSGQDREMYVTRAYSQLREQPYWTRFRSVLEAKGFPEKMPYYRDAVVGTDGIVWLEPYETWRAGERMYVGYDSTGAAVGKLRFPGSDRLLEIGNGIAVVRRTEELGTVNIYMQRYRRP